jgi:2,3-bisphosphoglycerate-dependent phosphoglycerate mutase
MKKIILVRHAESEENIGQHIEDSFIVRLTDLGERQSQELAEILDRPDRIIVSKYLRTQLTALPLINKYKESEVHYWIDVHEFQPHDRDKMNGLNKAEIKQIYIDYWAKCDPFLRQKDGLETFQEVIDRIIILIKKMKKIDSGINYVFSHGMLIRLLIFLQENIDLIKNVNRIEYSEIMKGFSEFNKNLEVNNVSTYDITSLVEKF